jgi:penicillin-binding protein-related factor A (putative recombinase)
MSSGRYWRYRRRGQKKGYDFEKEWAEALVWYCVRRRPIFYHKLADTQAFRSALRQIKIMFSDMPQQMKEKFGWVMSAFNRLTIPKQPGDFLVMIEGISGIMEVKSKSTKGRVWLSQLIKPHQYQYATRIELYGKGFYYFIINNRTEPQNHSVIALTRQEVREVLIAEDLMQRTGNQKGWTWDELLSFSHLPLITANDRRTYKDPMFTKYDPSVIFEDIREHLLVDSLA